MPSIFISYAHKDAWEFTNRLGFALTIYLGEENVFWDQKLQTGSFPARLEDEIKSRDYFLVVMSPYSERFRGWCRRELKIALQNRKKVIPLKISTHVDKLLVGRWNIKHAPFEEDFERGFRQLTEWILEDPLSSWEYMADERDHKVLLHHLAQGHVPGLIAKELGEWVIVDVLWTFVKHSLPERMFVSSPRTPEGILEDVPSLLKQSGDLIEIASFQNITKLREIIYPYVDSMNITKDNDHVTAGQHTNDIINKTYDYIKSSFAANLKAFELKAHQAYFRKDIAEKLRELIRMHSRRSRYLY